MTKRLNILIVDDELLIAEMIKEMLEELDYSIVGIAKNYNQAISYLDKGKIDLAILDINLNDKKDGVDLAMEIQNNYQIPYVYLTSYSDPITIRRVSKTSPSAYLLKPFTKDDLHVTIELIKSKQSIKPKSIVVKDGGLSVKLNAEEILYIKSDNNYLELITIKKKYVLRKSLEKFLKENENLNLLRIHRSYVVNIQRIDAINGQFVIVGNDKCPLSRSYKEEVLEAFSKNG
ncbi:LytR/AlgR family response regulator transcription factor [Ekhidna sp.]|uniref:LytR/AlgR family response regulator transcription factor n=1 Tax=Ekhidna sp. TaxID=2608089 RepID=UPI00351772BE